MKKIIGVRTIKTGIGSVLAMACADALGLKYMASAGIITILSIQSTKKESVQVALRRITATIVALVLGSLLFTFFSATPLIFGLYVILFIPITVRLKITEGIVPASVLVTHLLGEQMITSGMLINEILLMLVGAGVALLLNLYMPSIEKSLLQDKRAIEEEMYDILIHMSEALENRSLRIDESERFSRLQSRLDIGRNRAHKNANNYLMSERSPYEKYFEMRIGQFQVMQYMFKHFDKFFMTVEQSYLVADLTRQLAESVKGRVLVETLFEMLESLRANFKKSDLPISREEFENRAMLYQFLNDIEQFLDIKKRFKEELTPKEREMYNQYYHYE